MYISCCGKQREQNLTSCQWLSLRKSVLILCCNVVIERLEVFCHCVEIILVVFFPPSFLLLHTFF